MRLITDQVSNTRLCRSAPMDDEVQTMRIKMAGAYFLYEFEDAIDCILQSLEKNGVDELRSISIYCQPFSRDQLIEFDDQECGAPFQILRYNGRRRREFEVISPRLQPEPEALPVAAAIPMFDRYRPHGRIEQFIGLLEGQAGVSYAKAEPHRAKVADRPAETKITVASDVLVRAVLRDDEARAIAAAEVLKNAEMIAVPVPALCEFVEILQRTYALEPSTVAGAVRSLLNASNVVSDRSAVAAGLALLEHGGTFSEGVVAFEGQRLGANQFVSFDPASTARIERIMPRYR